ncbi:MG2 domain-containing protein [Cytophagaceae bacterium ABcell3]|nr:MG2 domain-containing protein [Cytophagaceae bacterium ABcell3]
MAAIAAVASFTSCQNTFFSEAEEDLSSEFKTWISAYTGGTISKEAPIAIHFTSDVINDESQLGKTAEDLFDFSPSIKGTTFWADKNTVQFQPNEVLPSGKKFKVVFHIGKVMNMPDDKKKFKFGFETMRQAVDVQAEGLSMSDDTDMTRMRLTGSLVSFDVAPNADIEKVLTASQDGKALTINWEHKDDRKYRKFFIEDVKRKETSGLVKIRWDGEAIGSDNKGELNYDVPALGEFKLVSALAIQGEEQYAKLEFSDPIDATQNLKGLISFSNLQNPRLVVDNNIVKVYPSTKQVGIRTVEVNSAIKNKQGRQLGKSVSTQIDFQGLKPEVKLSGKGAILPSTEGLNFPFEAVSLRSVRVTITKIYENNIIQFLQVNNLSQNNQLNRVGQVVLTKTVPLTNANPSDYSRWKKYYLDLSSLINTEPGAVYQVKLSFGKKDSMFSCEDNSDEATLTDIESEDEDFSIEESSNWDAYESYYAPGYNHTERDNPCSKSYYGGYRSVSQNIFASDLGLIGKIGSSGDFQLFVTDLKTTVPIAGAEVGAYDFQQQLITTLTTNDAGIASLELKKRPFMVIVKKDKQIGYLKLDHPSSLSVTNFDVAGAKVQNGLKGFIYGERGVWRPGDSLHLAFILEDKLNTIPENHPVVFELTNPMGQVVRRMVNANPVKGFYKFSTKTADDAPTGNWLATVKVGGAKFTRQVKVETIMPNRLKINLDFDTPKITALSNSLDAKMNVKWLHGAIAKKLNTDISMTLHKGSTKFEAYPEFSFDDPAKNFNSETMEIFKDRLDDKGEAIIKAKIKAEGNAPGVLNASFKTRVHEEGGGYSIDKFTLPYYPYTAFTGIRIPKGDKARNMLLTDTNHVVDIVSLDPDGKLLNNREIEVEVYKINWRWWWDRSEDNLSIYADNRYRQALQKQTITTNNGKGKFTLRLNYPEWGRYYIKATDKQSKHSTGTTFYMDWPGWAGSSQEKLQGGASILSFSADKESYKTGEKIVLNIPGNSQGRALVSIETGSKVLETHWVETENGKNQYTITATPEMSPTAYVNVTLVQPHAQTRNDLPIRLYGIIPLKIENPETVLNPVIAMKDELRPEETVSVSVKEEHGKPMTYTVAVVDEGLLDITRFKTPQPWNHFYAREALGVNTWDMYDQVIGAHGQRIEKVLSIGGDGELKGAEKSKTNRFKPVVKYFGPFSLEAGKTGTHSFKMPMYVGSVKTMVVAGNKSGAYGQAERVTPVRKPLMILATLPRVLGPEETVAVPVNVFAMTPEMKNVQVEIQSNKLLSNAGDKKKTIRFSKPGDEIVYFYLKAGAETGNGTITVTANCGSEKATYDIDIEIRNPNQPVTKILEEVIDPGKEWQQNFASFGVKGSNSGVLEVSSIPAINLESRMRYLIQYPYGCVEQTTSSVFPQLFVQDLIELPEETKKRVEQNIKMGIERIRNFQKPEGGLSYWPGSSSYDDWSTTYAGHFMLEAQKKGYTLPHGFINAWKSYQKKQARNWRSTTTRSDLLQAYRLYTLSLAGDAEMGAMNRLREINDLSPAARWRLASAYQIAGYPDVAKELLKGAPTNISNYKEMSYTYGSATRDRAMILETMTLTGMKTEAHKMLKSIAELLSSSKWMSTQETAFCLMAVSKYASNSTSDKEMKYVFSAPGQKNVHASTIRKIAQTDIALEENPSGKVSVKNTSSVPLFARVLLTGTPSTGSEEPASNNLALKINWKTKSGQAIDPSYIEQGSDFIAEVTVTHKGMGNYKNIALKQIFPSGWEIHNARLFGDESLKSDVPDYQDIRDDRVYTFFDLKEQEEKTFKVLLNASYSGRFYLPMTLAEAMYDGSVNAVVPGQWVEVVRKGEAPSAKSNME